MMMTLQQLHAILNTSKVPHPRHTIKFELKYGRLTFDSSISLMSE